VEVNLNSGELAVKGPKGTLSRNFRPDVEIKIESGVVTLAPKRNDKFSHSLWGTYASHIKNMIAGVQTPYQRKLILEGIGFKSEVKPARPDASPTGSSGRNSGHSGGGQELHLALGFSHPVKVTIPEGLSATAEKNLITVTGADKELVGNFAATIRALRKPEPYKGKGFRYEDEVIRRKQGKKTV